MDEGSLTELLANTPLIHDVPLELPAPRGLLIGTLIFSFMLHILFVNLMLGGSLVTVAVEIAGVRRRDRDLDTLAREVAQTITVNKSLAVVLGVAPLLAINVVYTLFFYSANALTGHAWAGVIPLAIVAFLLLYLHKYSWDWPSMRRNKWMHIGLGSAAVVCLLTIPFIFLANVNLMLFPERWADVEGFLSAVLLPNVLPRYLHFLLASVAVTGLVLVWYFGRSGYPAEERFEGLSRPALMRTFYRVAFIVTMMQLFAGPLVLLTLPWRGLSAAMVVVILTGLTFAISALVVLRAEVHAPDESVGRRFFQVVILLTLTVTFMVSGRHMYRERALIGPQVEMDLETKRFAKLSDDARIYAASALASMPADERLFKTNCSACHAIETVRSAPPVTEIAELHQGDPDAIVAWAINPGKKRKEFAEMPTMKHVGRENLRVIAEYILRVGTDPDAPTATQPSQKPAT